MFLIVTVKQYKDDLYIYAIDNVLEAFHTKETSRTVLDIKRLSL